MRLVYDLETNGLLKELDKVHCMAVIDPDSGKEWTFVNKLYRAPCDGTIEDGMDLLDEAEEIAGHNIITFDNRVFKKVYNFIPKARSRDTYIEGLCAFPDLKSRDFEMRRRQKRAGREEYPGQHCGDHRLKAWGLRLGIHKAAYGDNRSDWSTFDMDMLRYCMQDVRVNVALLKRLEKENVPRSVLELEQDFAYIMQLQQDYGFKLDVVACEKLLKLLMGERVELSEKLTNLFEPRVIKYLTKVKKLPRERTVPFNPGSRDQIAWHLGNQYDWKPDPNGGMTPGGKAKIDEKVLKSLPYPEALELARLFLLTKRISQMGEGKQAWLKAVGDDGRLHGRVINIGTPHGRCAHVRPNMAQVPNVTKEYGADCRALFVADTGKVIVGCDASGIQLRGLAHYMAKYDGGEYVDVVTKGDPHTKNQTAAGLPTRDKAKTFIYAFLFGAGDPLLAQNLKCTVKQAKATRAKFLKGMPALKKLLDKLSESGAALRGIDGRTVPVSKKHVRLNYLLTSFEVAVMKLATVLVHERLATLGLVFGTDYANVAHVHDEFQFECTPECADTVGQVARQAIVDAGVQLGSRCPLDGEYKIGKNWYETH